MDKKKGFPLNVVRGKPIRNGEYGKNPYYCSFCCFIMALANSPLATLTASCSPLC